MNLYRTVFHNTVHIIQIQPLANILNKNLSYVYWYLKTWNSFFWTGVRILIDSKAQLTLLGTEMDYQTDKLASEFIFNNPNIKGTCGCGESFNVWPIYWDSLWYGLWVGIFLSVLNVIICTWVVSLGEESEFSVWIDWWVTGCCKWINVDYDDLWCKWLVFEWA